MRNAKFVQIECDHCGNDQFYVYESADGEQELECEACGTIRGLADAADQRRADR